MEIIKSKDNKLIKHIKKLGLKKYRQENNQFIIEGIRFVEEAASAGASIKHCLFSDSLKSERAEQLLAKIRNSSTNMHMVEENIIQDICDTKTPQGIVAVIEKRDYSLDDFLSSSDFIIIVDRIQDPGNLGTIIRTADAANADSIVLSDGTVDPYSPKVLRSTMGSIFHLPLIICTDILDSLNILKSRGFSICAASLDGNTMYYKENYIGKTAIVIGNEGSGIDSNIKRYADKLVKIPMPGRAESLNAAVAAGILMFEVVRQRVHIDK